MRIVVLLCVVAFAVVAHVSEAYANIQWRAQWSLVSGNTHCSNSENYWVREGDGKFRLFDSNNSKEIWAADQSEDGSVKGAQVRSSYSNRPYRVTVPAGTAARAFDIVDMAYSCQLKVTPR